MTSLAGLLAPLALLIERFVGYPKPVLDRIGHPVMWFGQLIDLLEIRLNSTDRTARDRRDNGIIMLVLLLLATLIPTVVIAFLLRSIPFGWIIEAAIATPFLAQKQLGQFVRKVADRLDVSIEAGREAVSHIVGRDTSTLDEAGVSRAAVETLAENASDGVVAPLFWLILLGLPGIALYKAINTADSMVGYLNERYRDFGWASAKLDDVVNWIPARLTAILFVSACFFVPDASPSSAWQTARRDAGKHASPNAGWPEAAMAGALGLALGGPRAYQGETVDLPTMGSGRSELDAGDVRHALKLYGVMLNVAFVLTLFVGLMLSRG
jgi:adenosylcobinamide-phosphate synthase